MAIRKVHYVLSSHWDREWYQPFQDFRFRLVQLIDRLLEAWDSGRLCGPFQTDGQSILLEDYLEVRPNKVDEISRRVKEGRFILGPFYVQPDEFLVSGESLIRNLRMGREFAHKLGGEPSNAGLLADNFGHNSQMPQIFAGFGIRAAFLWRGTNLIDRRLFTWSGADGTEILGYRFGAEGYCSYAKFVRQQRLDEPHFTPAQIGQRLDAFLEGENAKTQAGPLLAFDGGDHMEWDPAAYSVFLNRMGQSNEKYRLVHSSLDDYLVELLPCSDGIDARLEGELREPARFPESVDKGGVAQNTGSSRVWIKRENAACETLLCQWAEPLSAFAHAALKLPYPHDFLEAAWKWLLQNHPHDSICGCSIDAVHADMAYRFRQSRQIAERLTLEATRKLAASVEGEVGTDELRCVVFNPLPQLLDEAVQLEVDLPVDWPAYGVPEKDAGQPAFRIYTAEGQEIPYQLIGLLRNQVRLRTFDTAFPRPFTVNRVEIALPLQVPPLGYTTLSVKKAVAGLPVRFPKTTSDPVITGLHSMSNAYLDINIEPNGTLTLTDERNGNTYRDLFTFEDTSDLGDAWNYVAPTNDERIFSTGCQAEIIRLQDGPYRASFLVRLAFSLPEEYDPVASHRSSRSLPLLIENKVTLRLGSDQVEIETTLQNNIRDHRLRLLFPTGTTAETYLTDTPFDVFERPVGPRPDAYLYRQAESETKPQQSWTAISAAGRGLAIISPGLYETAVINSPKRPVALTLLRATRRTVYTNGEPGGQVQGEQTYRFAICPLDSAPDRVDLFRRARQLAAGLRTVQLTRFDQELHRQPVTVSPSASFASVEGPLVLTSLHRTSVGLEIRLFNPETYAVSGALHLNNYTFAQAIWVDLESKPLSEPFPIQNHCLPIQLKAKEIKTVCWMD